MPMIKPISDLRNKANQISKIAHSTGKPIFITKNGEGDLVVMSLAHYGDIQRKLELYSKLAAAQAQKAGGDQGRELSLVMKDLRRKLNEKA